jgi:hypothetical protein
LLTFSRSSPSKIPPFHLIFNCPFILAILTSPVKVAPGKSEAEALQGGAQRDCGQQAAQKPDSWVPTPRVVRRWCLCTLQAHCFHTVGSQAHLFCQHLAWHIRVLLCCLWGRGRLAGQCREGRGTLQWVS